MRNLTRILGGAAALALILTGCSSSSNSGGGDDGSNQPPPPDSSTTTPPVAYHQVEQLARPAINEALLITTAYNNGYNATAPSFAGVDTPTLNAVVGEAKTVLQALYLGGCFINGVAGLTADTGVHPAGMTCNAVGAALLAADGVTQTAATKAAAKAYADKVFAQFEPDVMRIDTSVASNYLSLCGDANSTPLLCGGRGLADDTVDITYDYLLNGAQQYLAPTAAGALEPQFVALTSDGVVYSKTMAKNVDSLSSPDANNAQQGHPDFLATFPYSAPPL
jgi:hypothetical protein